MLEEDPVLESYRYKWRKVALGILVIALIFVIFRALATSGNSSPTSGSTPAAAH